MPLAGSAAANPVLPERKVPAGEISLVEFEPATQAFPAPSMAIALGLLRAVLVKPEPESSDPVLEISVTLPLVPPLLDTHTFPLWSMAIPVGVFRPTPV